MASLRMDPRADEDNFTSKAGDVPIKVLVGPDKTPFYIHEKVLRKPGMYFESALKEKWTHDHERVAELPVDKPTTFGLYVEWLYTGKIHCKKESDRNFGLLIELYVLGDKLLDTVFQDRIMDAMVAASNDMIKSNAEAPACRGCPCNLVHVNHIWQNTRSDAPIRKFVLDKFVLHAHETWDIIQNGDPGKANHEFLFDLAVELIRKRAVKQELRGSLSTTDSHPGCAYHHHGKDEPCDGKASAAKTR